MISRVQATTHILAATSTRALRPAAAFASAPLRIASTTSLTAVSASLDRVEEMTCWSRICDDSTSMLDTPPGQDSPLSFDPSNAPLASPTFPTNALTASRALVSSTSSVPSPSDASTEVMYSLDAAASEAVGRERAICVASSVICVLGCALTPCPGQTFPLRVPPTHLLPER